MLCPSFPFSQGEVTLQSESSLEWPGLPAEREAGAEGLAVGRAEPEQGAADEERW